MRDAAVSVTCLLRDEGKDLIAVFEEHFPYLGVKRPQAVCPHPAHRPTDWYLPSNEYRAGGYEAICGVCYPPAAPEARLVASGEKVAEALPA
jgi:hypothetical protein